jgi:predicted nucleic acid-binding protein
VNLLLDTNVVSEWVKPRPDGRVVAWLAELDEDRVFLSVATLGELRQGVELLAQGPRRSLLDGWVQRDLPERFAGRVLPVDAETADLWGRLVARRRRAGRPIGVMDALLAATASAHGLAVATRNTSDFQGCGVRLVNPWTARAAGAD